MQLKHSIQKRQQSWPRKKSCDGQNCKVSRPVVRFGEDSRACSGPEEVLMCLSMKKQRLYLDPRNVMAPVLLSLRRSLNSWNFHDLRSCSNYQCTSRLQTHVFQGTISNFLFWLLHILSLPMCFPCDGRTPNALTMYCT